MNNIIYDYIIVGAGPSGLTCAYYLNKLNKKCLVIDANDSIGGCHRVERVNGLFCEHSPRVYSNIYLNMITLLNDMNIKFHDIFTPYHFSPYNVGLTSINNFNFYEIFIFSIEFIKLLFGISNSHNISVLLFMQSNNFSDKAIDFSDRLCRLSDGAGADRYTLFQFLQLINQQSLYKLYDLRLPNDVGLFKLWKDKMPNVDFKMNTKINNINIVNNNIVDVNGFTASNYILAIPPKPLMNLLNDNNITNTFATNIDFNKWTSDNSYIDDICICYHWNSKLTIDDKWGMVRDSEWCICYKINTNYTDFQDNRSLTVISAVITNTDIKSKFTNKTANESSKNELINETFRQLNYSFNNTLPTATDTVMSPNIYYYHDGLGEYHNINYGKWTSYDTAYIDTNNIYINFQSNQFNNLYNLGTHNGKSNYSFTSMESAITNAIKLIHTLEPSTINKIKIIESYSLIEILRWIIIMIIIYYIVMKK